MQEQEQGQVQGQEHGSGIPRLQELSFLEVTLRSVSKEATFDEIRRYLVQHMQRLREQTAASGNVATYRLAEENPTRYVSNATESLKELMRLGLIHPAPLPRSGSAARAYRSTRFALTTSGEDWCKLLDDDVKAAYDELMARLWNAHPQLVGFVRALSNDSGFVVPLAQWGQAPEPRSRERYVEFLSNYVAGVAEREKLGWQASRPEVKTALVNYLEARYEAARARERTNPYPRNQDFVSACEEALVKFAFATLGVSLDYISVEIMRRWGRDLGISNFSYHVPGSSALRMWLTAELTEGPGGIRAERRVGDSVTRQVSSVFRESYEAVRRHDLTKSLWVPIYRVRAAVCWRLRLPDAVFDRALVEFLRRDQEESFGINVDPAQYGSVPPSVLPLRIQTSRGVKFYNSMSIVPKR